jgi:hypothetical protein
MCRSIGAKAAILAALALAGCSAGQRGEEFARPAPAFDVAAFFAGRTSGDGRLKILFKRTQRLRVEGSGRVEPDGTLVLDQVVHRGTRAPETRQWRIHPTGGGRYVGTLTDATGPVAADVRGNVLHLAYPMKGGTQAEQWIYLQPGGHLAINRMAIRKLGLTVATIDEAIRKAD